MAAPRATNERGRSTERRTLGQRAEEAALSYFVDQGCEILGRNVRVSRLELDLVVRDGPVVVVVEVRYRGKGAWVGALASVDAKKRLRTRRAGESLWRSLFKKDASLERMRFDIVSVHLGEGPPEIEHVRAAF